MTSALYPSQSNSAVSVFSSAVASDVVGRSVDGTDSLFTGALVFSPFRRTESFVNILHARFAVDRFVILHRRVNESAAGFAFAFFPAPFPRRARARRAFRPHRRVQPRALRVPGVSPRSSSGGHPRRSTRGVSRHNAQPPSDQRHLGQPRTSKDAGCARGGSSVVSALGMAVVVARVRRSRDAR